MPRRKGTLARIGEVLSSSSKEELQGFFNWYLRHDPKAQMQLLARFSDKMEMEEAEKYEWLFYKSIQRIRGSSQTLGISRQKSLLIIYSELYDQAADALAVNHFVKTFHILRNGLVFMRLLSHKEKTLHKDFADRFADYMKLLYKLYEADLPRDLIRLFIQFVDKELQLEQKLVSNSPYTYLRLKQRIEFQQNGLPSLLEYIRSSWTISAIKSADQLATFYFTLFTEPWFEVNIGAFAHLPIPREVFKRVMLKMHRKELGQTMELIWKTYKLAPLFEDDKYDHMVQLIKNAMSEEAPHRELLS